jgi:adenosylmethionine-8-amino-7-oxononanoate aminotransferase
VHLQTYHGHPVARATALEIQRAIQDGDLVQDCREMGQYLGETLRQRLGKHQHLGDVRGRGLFCAVSTRSLSALLPSDRSPRSSLSKTRNEGPRFRCIGRLRPVSMQPGYKKFEIALLPGGGVVDATDGELIVLVLLSR